MRRTGGIFVFGFFVVGLTQAVTGFLPGVPSVAAAVSIPREAEVTPGSKVNDVRSGSLPVKHWEELFNTWGRTCETLSPALLAAQLYQESIGFKNSVVSGRQDSPAGARGIAQFMPGTWKTQGIDGNQDGIKNILDPEDAIPSAAQYDCKVARGLKGVPGDSVANMLAGYNAGPGAVKKYGGVPPYKETQTYVRIIKAGTGRFS